MTVKQVVSISAKDTAAEAAIKATFREAIKGKVESTKLLIHTYEGTPAQRMQYENVPGTTFSVEQKTTVEIHNGKSLVEAMREVYGLNEADAFGPGFVPIRASDASGPVKATIVPLPVPEAVDQG